MSDGPLIWTFKLAELSKFVGDYHYRPIHKDFKHLIELSQRFYANDKVDKSQPTLLCSKCRNVVLFQEDMDLPTSVFYCRRPTKPDEQIQGNELCTKHTYKELFNMPLAELEKKFIVQFTIEEKEPPVKIVMINDGTKAFSASFPMSGTELFDYYFKHLEWYRSKY